jgi:hypothetical protein
VVRWGKCRNRGLAGLIGAVLIFVYYVGYWELSYVANIVARGPRMVAAVARIGQLPGLPGYVVFRCKTSRPVDVRRGGANARPPTIVDAIFNGIFFGGEALLIAVAGAGVGRSAASRAFSERYRRWASKFEFRLPLATATAVQEAIERGDWPSLAELPRVSSVVNANTNSLLFRLEYIPGLADEPAYVSLTGSAGGANKNLILQRQVPSDQLGLLAREFPELKIPQTEVAQEQSAPTALQASLDRLGFIDGAELRSEHGGVGGVPADFRDPAVATSRMVLARLHPRNLRTVPASLCLPAGPDSASELKRAGRWNAAVQVVLSAGMFGCLLIGFAGMMLADRRKHELDELMVGGVIGFFLFGIPNIIVSAAGDRVRKPFLAYRLRGRLDSLLDEGLELPSMVLRIEDARTYHKMKMSGEDLGIALFDAENRRILFEGLSHRYVIRGEDVTCFWPLQAHSIMSARIDYQIGDQRLAIVLARTNPWFHFWGPFANRAVEHFVSTLSQTLGCEPQAQTQSDSIG